MVDKIIIITTAIARMEMHNITFPLYKKFLGNDYPIEWYINIDKPSYCGDDVGMVESNLRKILNGYDLHISIGTKPNFFYAVKNLLIASRNEVTDNSYILWLEDDWKLNKDCTLKTFIENYGNPYSVINLVYNRLGSFPPFIMGGQLAKLFYEKYVTYDCPNTCPENISRKILRGIAKNIGITYYNCIHDLSILNSIQDPIESGLIYQETYLQINDCRILHHDPNYETDMTHFIQIPIHDLTKYKNEEAKRIIFVRFGTVQTNLKYRNSYFKDLGRKWKTKVCCKK